MSRLDDLAAAGSFEELEGLWLDMLPSSLEPAEASALLETLVRSGAGGLAAGLLEIAVDEMEAADPSRMAALVESAAPHFGTNEFLREHLVELLRDRHIMLGPLERFLSDSGLDRPGCDVSKAWGILSRLLRFDEGNWVLHRIYGPGLIRRLSRTSAVLDFDSNHNFDIPLDNLVETSSPIATGSVAVLGRKDPAAFSRLCADPGALLERLLEENGGSVDRQSLAPVLGRQAPEIWKALRDAAKASPGMMEGPDTIEMLHKGGLEEALRATLLQRQPLAARVERAAALLKATPAGEQKASAHALLQDMPDLRSVESGARYELAWLLAQASGDEPDPILSDLVDPVPMRALQALSEISAPKCRKDYLSRWTKTADPAALEEMVEQLPAGQRPMLLEAAARTHPGWAGTYLRGIVFAGTDPDLLLWASSVLLDRGLDSPEETTAIIRAALDAIPRGRADSQRRASRMIVERAGDELRVLLKNLDARKLANLSDILGGCGPAHEAGLCLEIRRESSGRSADSGRTYFFWESDYVFDSPLAIRRRADALEKLRTVEIPAAAASVGEAASHGDLSENAEYKAALERRDLLLERMARWSDEFSRLRPYPMNDLVTSVSSPGTSVSLAGVAGKAVIDLVGPLEARPEEGRVNYLAPLGSALLGRHPGELIELPGRDGVFTVESIRILPAGEDA